MAEVAVGDLTIVEVGGVAYFVMREWVEEGGPTIMEGEVARAPFPEEGVEPSWMVEEELLRAALVREGVIQRGGVERNSRKEAGGGEGGVLYLFHLLLWEEAAGAGVTRHYCQWPILPLLTPPLGGAQEEVGGLIFLHLEVEFQN